LTFAGSKLSISKSAARGWTLLDKYALWFAASDRSIFMPNSVKNKRIWLGAAPRGRLKAQGIGHRARTVK
jgi:hypothetical protein